MVDTFAHGLWSLIIFRNLPSKAEIWLAVLFGIMPDLFSWSVYLGYKFFTGGWRFGPPVLSSIPKWIFVLYGITHSIFVFALVIGIVFLLMHEIPVYLWAWLIHIVIDIPTHSKEFLPTPFLWPISNWYFPGISWGHPAILFLNWGGIIFFLFYYFVFKK